MFPKRILRGRAHDPNPAARNPRESGLAVSEDQAPDRVRQAIYLADAKDETGGQYGFCQQV